MAFYDTTRGNVEYAGWMRVTKAGTEDVAGCDLLYFAMWCPHCRQLIKQLGSIPIDDSRVKRDVVFVNCSDNSDVPKLEIKAYPSAFSKGGVAQEDYRKFLGLSDKRAPA